jgi:hypothetical protein
MIGLAVAGLGLGIALGMGWLGGGTSVRPEPSPRREPMDRHRRGEVSPSRNEPRRRPPAEIPKRQAAIRLVAVEPSLFAAEGYRPAPPGKIYWRVRTEITAGNATTVQTYGKEARLQLGDATITALGQAAGAPPMPLGWAPSVLKLVAGERRQVTLVFEVPAAAGVGKLTFGRFGTLDVGPVRSPKPGDADLEGLWGEVPPRNLKPLLEDPVMAALQHAADHSMRIERTGNELRISIPAAGVQGSLTPGRNGVHQALLRAGDATLTCKLRSYDDGRGMVLYLRERPFYQLTYRKQ